MNIRIAFLSTLLSIAALSSTAEQSKTEAQKGKRNMMMRARVFPSGWLLAKTTRILGSGLN